MYKMGLFSPIFYFFEIFFKKIKDRLATDRETYRIQSVEEEHFFGTVTHKNLQLVKLNGR